MPMKSMILKGGESASSTFDIALDCFWFRELTFFLGGVIGLTHSPTGPRDLLAHTILSALYEKISLLIFVHIFFTV